MILLYDYYVLKTSLTLFKNFNTELNSFLLNLSHFKYNVRWCKLNFIVSMWYQPVIEEKLSGSNVKFYYDRMQNTNWW